MQKAYFKNIQPQILAAIQSAQTEIKIAIAWFTNKTLFDALLESLNRGVSIELIIQYDGINCNDKKGLKFELFIEKGGKLYFKQGSLLHHKFCIIDEKVLISGSYNWTYYAEDYNHENVIVTKDRGLIIAFKEELELIRAELLQSEIYLPIPFTDIKEEISNLYLEYIYKDWELQKYYELNITEKLPQNINIPTQKSIKRIDGNTNTRYTYSISVYKNHIYLDLVYDGYKYSHCYIYLNKAQIQKLIEAINYGIINFPSSKEIRKDRPLYKTEVVNCVEVESGILDISVYLAHRNNNIEKGKYFGIGGLFHMIPYYHWHIPVSQKDNFLKNLSSALKIIEKGMQP